MTTTQPQHPYVFGNAWQQEDERLALLEAGWDAKTFRHLDRLGVAEGWRCLEVGGGGGSVTRWLCRAVGPGGRVVATDLDARFLLALDESNLVARVHNIVTDDLEQGWYDLVHTRLVLEHIPERDRALDRMVAALKPGGWLLAEEFDHATMLPVVGSSAEEQALWARFLLAFQALSAQRGLDLAYGGRLPGVFRERGLTERGVEATVQLNPGGSPLSRVLSLSIARMREGLTGTGQVDGGALETLMARLDDPAFGWMSQTMVAAWGRRAA